jgi:hypothetical protein
MGEKIDENFIKKRITVERLIRAFELGDNV